MNRNDEGRLCHGLVNGRTIRQRPASIKSTPCVGASTMEQDNMADLDIQSLRPGMSGRLVGSQVLYYQALASTMDEARRLADEGQVEGTVVIAEEQTAGRGRFHRSWVSPPGQNLSFSVILRPGATQLRYVNMAAALAVSGAFVEFTGLAPAIKWPNDVMVNGRKVSGILVETAVEAGEPRHTVVGIGVNVNLDPSRFPEISSTATSLYLETGRRMDRTEVIQSILERLDDLYCAVKGGQSLTQQWASQLETLGRNVQVRWGDRLLEGYARAVDEQGNLLLSQPDGSTVTVVAGEVTLQK